MLMDDNPLPVDFAEYVREAEGPRDVFAGPIGQIEGADSMRVAKRARGGDAEIAEFASIRAGKYGEQFLVVFPESLRTDVLTRRHRVEHNQALIWKVQGHDLVDVFRPERFNVSI